MYAPMQRVEFTRTVLALINEASSHATSCDRYTFPATRWRDRKPRPCALKRLEGTTEDRTVLLGHKEALHSESCIRARVEYLRSKRSLTGDEERELSDQYQRIGEAIVTMEREAMR